MSRLPNICLYVGTYMVLSCWHQYAVVRVLTAAAIYALGVAYGRATAKGLNQ